VSDARITEAYAVCRAIAKREAKNFYYAFRVLPQHKSDAMCAVYAFMRKADDLADDESMTVAARREAMATWTAAWRASRTTPTDDLVFIALNDTQQRFNISDELLEQLVAGTTMDLQERPIGVVTVRAGEQSMQVFETFDDLYKYCYLVASVVGLVCIRIFGYTDPSAEGLAEQTGIAFQLTNILRDVKEDTERGRIYLPLTDMQRTGLDVERLCGDVKSGMASAPALAVLQLEIHRAQQYYRASGQLIPLLDADSREAMSVLVRIYHELLERIESDPAAVFATRVSVPTWRKLFILAAGMVKTSVRRNA
jgi:phytoene synthase